MSKSPYYELVDVGGENGQPSNWNFGTASVYKPLKPFDYVVFLKLLKGAE